MARPWRLGRGWRRSTTTSTSVTKAALSPRRSSARAQHLSRRACTRSGARWRRSRSSTSTCAPRAGPALSAQRTPLSPQPPLPTHAQPIPPATRPTCSKKPVPENLGPKTFWSKTDFVNGRPISLHPPPNSFQHPSNHRNVLPTSDARTPYNLYPHSPVQPRPSHKFPPPKTCVRKKSFCTVVQNHPDRSPT